MTPFDDPAAWITPALPGMEPPPQETYTREEVAKLFRVTLWTLNWWCKTGQVESPHYRGLEAYFTAGQVARMSVGRQAKGTWTPTTSPRAEMSKRGKAAVVQAAAEAAAIAAAKLLDKRKPESIKRAERRARAKLRATGGAA